MHRRRMSIAAAIFAVSLLAFAGGVTAATGRSAAPKLGGTWSGKYGGAFTGTFTLTWKQTRGRLTGAIKLSKPSGSYRITGHVSGGAIKFGAVGVGATYTGSVNPAGLKMSGNWSSGNGGSGTWSAHKLLTVVKIKLP
ncbi:MAG TPA: hypothetical protein VLJ44_11015 [Gaiellaceae bacterium]|nr:hypothetical protein [Gaiellaceae bacterium]